MKYFKSSIFEILLFTKINFFNFLKSNLDNNLKPRSPIFLSLRFIFSSFSVILVPYNWLKISINFFLLFSIESNNLLIFASKFLSLGEVLGSKRIIPFRKLAKLVTLMQL